MKLIAIGHRSGHGKDTFADMLVKHFGLAGIPAKKVSWAYKGKIHCYELYRHYGLKHPDFYETPEGRAVRNVKLPGIDKTPVELWIDYMNAVRDHVDPLTWCNALLNDLEDYNGVAIAADTRLAFELPKAHTTIKVVNSRVPDRVGKSIDDVLAGYTGWNMIIPNDGTLEDLDRFAGATVASLILEGKLWP